MVVLSKSYVLCVEVIVEREEEEEDKGGEGGLGEALSPSFEILFTLLLRFFGRVHSEGL